MIERKTETGRVRGMASLHRYESPLTSVIKPSRGLKVADAAAGRPDGVAHIGNQTQPGIERTLVQRTPTTAWSHQ